MQKIRTILWCTFLVFTIASAIVMPFEIGGETLQRLTTNPGLLGAFQYLLGISDSLWIVLAATVTYLFVLSDRDRIGRIWAVILLTGVTFTAWLNLCTGLPFGPLAYTGNMGARIFGGVPFTLPLLWMTVLLCSRYAVLTIFPRARRLQIALGSATLALLTDLNLEFVAWKVRAWWIWYPPGSALAGNPPVWPPLQNFVAWFVLAFLLILCLPEVTTEPKQKSRRLLMLLGLLNAVFLLVHLVRWIRLGGN